MPPRTGRERRKKTENRKRSLRRSRDGELRTRKTSASETSREVLRPLGIPDPCGYQSGVGELRPREKKNTEVPRPCREAPGRGNGGKSDAAATYRVGAQMLATGDPAATRLCV